MSASRSTRNIFDFGCLIEGQAPEIAEPDEIRNIRIVICKSRECFVQLKEIPRQILIDYSNVVKIE